MKNKQFNELAVCGFEAVRSLAIHNAHLITRLYYTENKKAFFSPLCKELAQNKKPYNLVEPRELEKLCGSTHHEGVVAMISRLELRELSFPLLQEIAKEGKTILLLDRISNANNLGAIVRSCAFFGIKTIILSNDDAQSSVTTSTYRIAKGGMDLVTIYKTESVNRLLSDIKGLFVSVGTDVRTEHTLQGLQLVLKDKGLEKLPSAVVLGNEEKGMSDLVKKSCDVLVRIPSIGEGIESLNVAQAASVLLYELTK